MTDGERLLVSHPAFPDLLVSLQFGRLTESEAVFLAQRVEVHLLVEWMPKGLINIALDIHDRLYEPL